MSKNFPTATALVRNKFWYLLINVIHWNSVKTLDNFAENVTVAVAYTEKCFNISSSPDGGRKKGGSDEEICSAPWVMVGVTAESSLLGNHYKAPVNSGNFVFSIFPGPFSRSGHLPITWRAWGRSSWQPGRPWPGRRWHQTLKSAVWNPLWSGIPLLMESWAAAILGFPPCAILLMKRIFWNWLLST